MDPAQLKTNFEEQIAKTDSQITELETNLAKAKEYKLKLVGGLETLGLLAVSYTHLTLPTTLNV